MVIAIISSLALYQYLPAIVITFFALLSEFVQGFIVKSEGKTYSYFMISAPRKAIIKTKTTTQRGPECNNYNTRSPS